MTRTPAGQAAQAPTSLLTGNGGKPWPFMLDRAGPGCGGLASWAGSRPASLLLIEPSGQSRLWSEGVWSSPDLGPVESIARFVEAGQAEALAPVPMGVGPLPRTVGFIAYELGAFIEKRMPRAARPSKQPLAVLCTYDRVQGWDRASGRSFALDFSRRPTNACPPPLPVLDCEARDEDNDRKLYASGFARIARAIRDGEIYQANLSRCIAVNYDAEPWQLYESMRRHQPVPRGFFMDCGGLQVLGNSPECLLAIDGERISTFPIKGTRARAAQPALDEVAAAELLADPKEMAEHLMIVDLERNDLGRVCATGSVEVTDFAALRSFATVHHLESQVRGRLRPGTGLEEILGAVFPGGSITGAPRIRAVEIIAEVEQEERGVYTGSCGSFNGPRSVDLNVAIRTAVGSGGQLRYRSGGGVVADSTMENEYEETHSKARAFLEALALRSESAAAGPSRAGART
ncbi:MAG: anthranilate synthase component I family protein [bacterium]|nr:anthranilate synthase component I family protein [Candidatus Binatota bacterium]